MAERASKTLVIFNENKIAEAPKKLNFQMINLRTATDKTDRYNRTCFTLVVSIHRLIKNFRSLSDSIGYGFNTNFILTDRSIHGLQIFFSPDDH
jgi:hypothetical protein